MAAPQQTKFTIPLTWNQWRLGRPDTYAEFQLYGVCVLRDQYNLFTQVATTSAQRANIRGLRDALCALINPPAMVPAPAAQPTAAMVAAALESGHPARTG
jgi:hypothetical protein